MMNEPKLSDSLVTYEEMLQKVEEDAETAADNGEQVGLVWKYAYAVNYLAQQRTVAKHNAAMIAFLQDGIHQALMDWVKGNEDSAVKILKQLENSII